MFRIRRFFRWLTLSESPSVTEPVVPVSVMMQMLAEQKAAMLEAMEAQRLTLYPQAVIPSQKLWLSEDDEDRLAIEYGTEPINTMEKAETVLGDYLESLGLNPEIEYDQM